MIRGSVRVLLAEMNGKLDQIVRNDADKERRIRALEKRPVGITATKLWGAIASTVTVFGVVWGALHTTV